VFIADEWTVEQVVDVCDAEGARSIQSHDDLTFGDYQRMLEDADRSRLWAGPWIG
jgi:hypothetical protein